MSTISGSRRRQNSWQLSWGVAATLAQLATVGCGGGADTADKGTSTSGSGTTNGLGSGGTGGSDHETNGGQSVTNGGPGTSTGGASNAGTAGTGDMQPAAGAGGEAGGGGALDAGGAPGTGGDTSVTCPNQPGANQALLNGGFESLAAADIITVAAGTEPEGFGWTVTTNAVEVLKVGYSAGGMVWDGAAFEGEQYLDLVALGSTGAISQTLSVTAGTHYLLTFAYSDNPNITPQGVSARVTIADCEGALVSKEISHDTATFADLDWSSETLEFVARSTSVTLEFVTTDARGNGGIFLDGIVLASE